MPIENHELMIENTLMFLDGKQIVEYRENNEGTDFKLENGEVFFGCSADEGELEVVYTMRTKLKYKRRGNE